ncbi:MAG: DivIVA domain-containing protein [Bacillota bacterium]|nr:DivIVA domain-containing protein [Bacillota bacterium]
MPVSTKDIIDKVFKTASKGYNKDEVDAFLDEIIEEFNLMSHKIEAIENQLAMQKEKEAMRGQPDGEYARTITDAQKKAYEILEEAKSRAEALSRNTESSIGAAGVAADSSLYEEAVQTLQAEVGALHEKLEYIQERVQSFVLEMNMLLDEFYSSRLHDTHLRQMGEEDSARESKPEAAKQSFEAAPGESTAPDSEDKFSFDNFEKDFAQYKDKAKEALLSNTDAPIVPDALGSAPVEAAEADKVPADQAEQRLKEDDLYSLESRADLTGNVQARKVDQPKVIQQTKPENDAGKPKSFSFTFSSKPKKEKAAESSLPTPQQTASAGRIITRKLTVLAPLEIAERKPRPKPSQESMKADIEYIIPRKKRRQ